MSDAAIVNLVSGTVTVVTIIVGFLTLWVKLRYASNRAETIEGKLDENTIITQTGTRVAAANAQIAAANAKIAATSAKDLSDKLNGGVDKAVVDAIAPTHKALTEHVEQDAKDISDINDKLSTLSTQVGLILRNQLGAK